MIHLLRTRATKQQLDEMLDELELYIKLAVDVRQEILAGGGELHSDCEEVLIDAGCQQENIWGADWVLPPGQVRYESIINYKPLRNRSSNILDSTVRSQVERIVRSLLEDA